MFLGVAANVLRVLPRILSHSLVYYAANTHQLLEKNDLNCEQQYEKKLNNRSNIGRLSWNLPINTAQYNTHTHTHYINKCRRNRAPATIMTANNKTEPCTDNANSYMYTYIQAFFDNRSTNWIESNWIESGINKEVFHFLCFLFVSTRGIGKKHLHLPNICTYDIHAHCTGIHTKRY